MRLLRACDCVHVHTQHDTVNDGNWSGCSLALTFSLGSQASLTLLFLLHTASFSWGNPGLVAHQS